MTITVRERTRQNQLASIRRRVDEGMPELGRFTPRRIRFWANVLHYDRIFLLKQIDLYEEDLRLTRAERDAEKHKCLELRRGQGRASC